MTTLSLLTFDDWWFKPDFFHMWEEDGSIYVELDLAAHRYWKGKSYVYKVHPLDTIKELVRQLCGRDHKIYTTGVEIYSAPSSSWRSLWSAYMDWQALSVRGNGRTIHFVNAKEVINLEEDWPC